MVMKMCKPVRPWRSEKKRQRGKEFRAAQLGSRFLAVAYSHPYEFRCNRLFLRHTRAEATSSSERPLFNSPRQTKLNSMPVEPRLENLRQLLTNLPGKSRHLEFMIFWRARLRTFQQTSRLW